MELYSINGSEPQEISMLVFPDGSTRTGDDYTEEEYERAGVTGPYIRPEYDESFSQLSWDSENLKYVISEYSDEDYMKKVREYRDYLLRSSDCFMIEDFAMEESLKNAFKIYRAYLRDIPQKIESGKINLPKNRNDYDKIFAENRPVTKKSLNSSNLS